MNLIDRFEQRALFSLTRFMALLVVALLLLGVVGSAVYLLTTLSPERSVRVDPLEIINQIRPLPPLGSKGESASASRLQNEGISTAMGGSPIPFVLQPYLSKPEARAMLERHLRPLDPQEAREYVDNLADTIAAAEKENLDAERALKLFLDAKDSRIASLERERQRKKEMRLYIAGGVVSTMVLIALFSLILVLLAIERNTRSNLTDTREHTK